MSTAATATAVKVKEKENLIRTITLTVQEMTPETFAPFGEIIGSKGDVNLDLGGGNAGLVAQTVEHRPLTFDFLGRHMQTEQVFAPLGGAQSIIAVAASNDENSAVPDIMKMSAFMVDGTSAFKLHKGTWHASAFPLGESTTFLVLDREGTLESDYDLRDLKTSLGVVVEIQVDN